jgi:spore coat polysaccharide biosynthesis protein SpsF
MVEKTEQEIFWKETFGNNYIDRNNNNILFNSKKQLFRSILNNIDPIKSVIEFGANIGLNLKAIQEITEETLDLTAIEINNEAAMQLKNNIVATLINNSIIGYKPIKSYNFVLTMGLLIHLNPKYLDDVYDILYNSSSKYICIAEYYNRTPVSIDYRGERNKLFKRDFAGEMLNKYPDLKLINYGFVYHKDPNYPLDDITWFLLKK